MGKEKIKPFFVDANIFLEVELGDERSAECKALFSSIHKGLRAATSDFIVYTCLLQLAHKSSLEKMQGFIIFLDNMESIEIHSPNYQIIYNAFDLMARYSVDFDDALVVSIMKSRGIERLVSFDRDFDRIKGIKRIEPADA